MKNRVLNKFISVLALCFFANASQATLITEISHDFGSDIGKVEPVGGIDGSSGCNTLGADWVKVTDKRNCVRFYDSFDLSVLNFDSIDSFTLSLTFSNTNKSVFFGIIPAEFWSAQSASSGNNADQANGQSIDRVGGITTQDFIFNASNSSVFSDILTNNTFAFWLGEEALGSNDFKLYNATLRVEGTISNTSLESTSVPEPNMLALFALGLLFMSRSRFSK